MAWRRASVAWRTGHPRRAGPPTSTPKSRREEVSLLFRVRRERSSRMRTIRGRRADNVEVLFPESQVVGSGNPSSVADNNDLASTSSAFVDSATLVEKVIAKLPAEVHAHATDSKRKAKSQDPGWKFGWWPDPTKKDFIRCIFCLKVVPSRIKRFKQHLVGGFSDTTKCSMVPEVVSNDMYAYLKRNTRLVLSVESEEGGQKDGDATEPEQK
ncbi:hypothetical protein ZEAMMB73_Zm00001d047905 [Zea mays]|uniref:BED-type domain-containing protein n=1 Tax=Zea mays TaxID=4577 RepID=A0A1D6PEP2_MAIZE|nr:hypothetical protein ZEAMMB73_Zm00001d047905 [Zea mays]